MRAIVFSDSHGDSASINMLLSLHRNADMFIYLGDGEEDLFMPQNLNIIGTKPLIAVKGNNDFGSSLPAETTCFLSGKKIYALHGHTKGVKYSTDLLQKIAMESNADVILYGHTHIPRVEYMAGVYFMCPGAIYKGEYGIVDVDEKTKTVLCHTANL